MANVAAVSDDMKNAVDEQDHEGFLNGSIQVMTGSASYIKNLSGDGKEIHPKSAINGQNLAPVKQTTKPEYDELLDNSRKAQAIWERIPVAKRQQLLKILADRLEERADKIGFSISMDVGKGPKDSVAESTKLPPWVKWLTQSSTVANLAPTDVVSKHGVPQSAKIKKAAGVVGVMTSFNYPLVLSLAGIIPGILAGNSVIMKGASKAPHWVFFFQDAFQEAMTEFTLKEGARLGISGEERKLLVNNLFTNIHGRDNTLVTDVDNAFFVGGSETGEGMAAKRAQKQKEIDGRVADLRKELAENIDDEEKSAEIRRLIKKTDRVLTTHLELGGNSAMIVLGSAFEGIEGDEARDEKAQEIAQMIFDGAYGNSGQRCTAARMLIMDGSPEALLVYEKFIALVEQEHKIGNAFDGENLYGALNDAGAAFKMDALTAAANSLKDQGYVVKTHGGGRISENEAPKGGIYYRPAVLDWREVPIDVMKSTKIVIGHKWDKEAGAEVPVETSLYEALRHETFGPMVNIVAQAKDREHAVELVKEWDAEGLAAGGVGNKADLEYLHKELEEGKVVTTFNSNGTPKDHSPNRAHGNVSQPFHTGGEHWDESYTREFETTDRAEIEQAQIVHRNSGLALAS